MQSDEELLKVALEAAAEAGRKLKKFFGSQNLRVSKKFDYPGSLVTNADHAAEKIIIDRIRKARVKSTVVSEEAGTIELGSRELVWAVDPLDGTLNFVKRIPYFGVSMGILRGRTPLVGVVYNPILDEMFTAVRGKGAFLNGRRTRVSATRRLHNSSLIFEWWEPEPSVPDPMGLERRLYKYTRRLRSPGSIALNLCSVASGRFDGMLTIFQRSPIYEIAAGCLIVQEAGGKMTNSLGEPWETFSRSIIGAGPAVHAKLLTLLRSSRKSK